MGNAISVTAQPPVTVIYMGVSTKTGYKSKCRAKDPNHCRFHTPGTHEKYDPEGMRAFNEKKSEADAAADNGDNVGIKLSKKHDAGNSAGASIDASAINEPNDEHIDDSSNEANDDYDGTERITTLLTERVSLQDDRKGRVPEYSSEDTVTKGVAKLGRYIDNNYDGVEDEDMPAVLSSLYGKSVTVPDGPRGTGDNDDSDGKSLEDAIKDLLAGSHDDAGTIPDSVRGTMRDMKTRDPKLDPHVYMDDNGEWYIVTRNTPARWLKSSAQYTRSGIHVHMVNLGQVIAVDGALKRIPFERIDDDKVRAKARHIIASDLLDKTNDGKFTYTFINHGIPDDPKYGRAEKLNKAREEYGMSLVDTDTATYSELESAYDEVNNERKRRGAAGDLSRFERSLTPYMITDANKHVDDYLVETLSDERNGELNRNYARRINAQHSATVFEDKKHCDDEHLRAARTTAFKTDFNHIEIDDSVDLAKLSKLETEYDSYRSRLPRARVRADFRLRKTGRHNASGVYTPRFRNIAVDPRTPSSFTHEYMHHLDFTQDANGRQLSMSPGFRDIVSDYQSNLDRSRISGDIERYIAPTEIFARSGELWMHWRDREDGRGDSSFTSTDDEYGTRPDYAPLLSHKREIMDMFNGLFTDAVKS